MDSAYLKKNVLPALTEALTAMAVQIPEDQVEFIGRYLLAYVDRKGQADETKKAVADLDAKLALQIKEDVEKERLLEEKHSEATTRSKKYSNFLQSIQNMSSKAEALDNTVHFLESAMGIPSAYAAVKEVAGETEVLKYTSAGSHSQHILGKKLPKPSGDDGEDAPKRQGVSFEAFKLPEVPEEEEPAEPAEPAEGEEAAEPAPPKGPPAPLPLVIVNVMRDQRVRFFVTPRLGAYAACPFIYPSLDHDQVVVYNAGDAENPPTYALTKKDAAFMIAVDTVGKYRQFEKAEIDRVMAIGNQLVDLNVRLEAAAGEELLGYLQGEELAALTAAVVEMAAKMPEEEANALAEAAAALAAQTPAPVEGEPAAEAPAPVEGAELIKAKKDAVTVLKVWNSKFGNGPISKGLLAMKQHVLPIPGPALKLLCAVGYLVNIPATSMLDVCGDPSWEVFRREALTDLSLMIATFDPTEAVTLCSKAHTLAAVKAFCEANAVLDAGSLPSYMPVFASTLLGWFQKALAAREAAIACSAEVDKVNLELLKE